MVRRGVGRIVKRVYKMVPDRTGKKHRRYVGIDAKGRWKFLKTPGGETSKSRTTKSKTKTRKTSKSGGSKRMGKGGKSLQRTLFKWLRIGALVAPAAYDLMRKTTPQGKAVFLIETYTGYNIDKGQWDPRWLARGWLPYLMTCLLTHGIPKLTGIIRRI